FHVGTGEITIGGNLTNSGATAVFNAGDGDDGLHVFGNLSNLSGATFNVGSDSVGVRGSAVDQGAFNAVAGISWIRNNFSNTSGAFTGGSGVITIGGALTNNASFATGSGTVSVGGTLTNAGAGASFALGGGALILSGNFVNTSPATFNATSGT